MDDESLPFASIIRQGAITGGGERTAQQLPASRHNGTYHDLMGAGTPPVRFAALERFLAIVPDRAAVIATTGKCGRELFTLCDREQHLYQVGSMGGASAMALGVALNTQCPIVVLDGDGSALMKLGNLSTIGSHAPENLTHVILDNNAHDSTGGQPTSSNTVDFARVALSCGYRSAFRTDSLSGFETSLSAAFRTAGPTLIHLKIRPGSLDPLARPSIGPREVARRFQEFLADKLSYH